MQTPMGAPGTKPVGALVIKVLPFYGRRARQLFIAVALRNGIPAAFTIPAHDRNEAARRGASLRSVML